MNLSPTNNPNLPNDNLHQLAIQQLQNQIQLTIKNYQFVLSSQKDKLQGRTDFLVQMLLNIRQRHQQQLDQVRISRRGGDVGGNSNSNRGNNNRGYQTSNGNQHNNSGNYHNNNQQSSANDIRVNSLQQQQIVTQQMLAIQQGMDNFTQRVKEIKSQYDRLLKQHSQLMEQKQMLDQSEAQIRAQIDIYIEKVDEAQRYNLKWMKFKRDFTEMIDEAETNASQYGEFGDPRASDLEGRPSDLEGKASDVVIRLSDGIDSDRGKNNNSNNLYSPSNQNHSNKPNSPNHSNKNNRRPYQQILLPQVNILNQYNEQNETLKRLINKYHPKTK